MTLSSISTACPRLLLDGIICMGVLCTTEIGSCKTLEGESVRKLILLLVMIISALLVGCAETPTPTPTNQQPIEVASVSGPLQPINPGGPIVEITLKNVSTDPIVSLTATLELSRAFTFGFDLTSSNPLLPARSVSAKLTLIGGGFSDNISYPLRLEGTLQNGATFAYTKQVRIMEP
jgi:hypothetical protein